MIEMPDAVAFTEIEEQHVELLPARTTLTTSGSGGSGGVGGVGSIGSVSDVLPLLGL